jgi:hypothetical protein
MKRRIRHAEFLLSESVRACPVRVLAINGLQGFATACNRVRTRSDVRDARAGGIPSPEGWSRKPVRTRINIWDFWRSTRKPTRQIRQVTRKLKMLAQCRIW